MTVLPLTHMLRISNSQPINENPGEFGFPIGAIPYYKHLIWKWICTQYNILNHNICLLIIKITLIITDQSNAHSHNIANHHLISKPNILT